MGPRKSKCSFKWEFLYYLHDFVVLYHMAYCSLFVSSLELIYDIFYWTPSVGNAKEGITKGWSLLFSCKKLAFFVRRIS